MDFISLRTYYFDPCLIYTNIVTNCSETRSLRIHMQYLFKGLSTIVIQIQARVIHKQTIQTVTTRQGRRAKQ